MLRHFRLSVISVRHYSLSYERDFRHFISDFLGVISDSLQFISDFLGVISDSGILSAISSVLSAIFGILSAISSVLSAIFGILSAIGILEHRFASSAFAHKTLVADVCFNILE
ncbi:hypothetical protein [Lysinibacillus sp. G4S2]|uniref:hypothetical protein n=1 Tax=Lysinibacillus sp. G4S2 TaxID=3055859 RepID=UPI0025A0B3A4|nr:hypothetical protein [Lysinibacillus sp. G4S2]MDM5249891.1 hypothetical protein [Lysinibacillus sp. G4S2]